MIYLRVELKSHDEYHYLGDRSCCAYNGDISIKNDIVDAIYEVEDGTFDFGDLEFMNEILRMYIFTSDKYKLNDIVYTGKPNCLYNCYLGKSVISINKIQVIPLSQAKQFFTKKDVKLNGYIISRKNVNTIHGDFDLA